MTRASTARKQRRKPQASRISNAVPIMSFDKKRAKQPFDAPPVPDELCEVAGKVAITWGLVEQRIDDLILALEKATGESPSLKHLNFNKRKERCKDLAKSVFASNPALINELRKILGNAADAHWKRNFIMHGRMKSRLHANSKKDPIEITSELIVKSRHNGRDVTLYFDIDGLSDLFYSIANVCGRLMRFISPDISIPDLSGDDSLKLRTFLLENHPTLVSPQAT